ncbi:DUF120 domain-containing protein [Halomarina ordinaria]|uniref:Riboflavin kinase n=1 Tax=Halomarina ordinaria TaxID=3033939 RepID=A0ABD5UI87_9EURY|nr:DUF120 domain-containing protein [Halomarina sp. PSRA2]
MAFSIDGAVSSGIGTGKDFVVLDGYADQFEERLGYEPYPGTLNLVLDRRVDGAFDALDAILVEGWEADGRSFGGVDCYPASVVDDPESVRLHAVVPRRTDHDATTVEFVSPVDLRETFGLDDGDRLEVRIESG